MSDRFFRGLGPLRGSLIKPGGGLKGEIFDLRTDVARAFERVVAEQTRWHEPTITASRQSAIPGQGATPVEINATLALRFTLNADRVYRVVKIPHAYAGSLAFHTHWTKSTDDNDLGRAVRWRLEYTVWPGNAGSLASVETAEVEGTYGDTGTTTRTVYRTPDTPLLGAQPGYYLSLRLSAVTPTGTPLTGAPALISLDVTAQLYINQGFTPPG
jgi:hypothetical protein